MIDALPEPVARALGHVRARSRGGPLDDGLRVTLNFHPDRLFGGDPILRAMARDGLYRSQFETRTSNGGLTAHPGGDRWSWESRIFGAAYDAVEPGLRPKYGALNRFRAPYGGAPRFGSAHLRLAPHTLARTTFCYPDSVFDPEHFGVADRYALSELADAHPALFPGAEAHDPLDDYVEAHVHGVLDLRADVEAIVLDPCYRGGPVEEDAARLGVEVEWHAGYVLDVDTLRAHPGYRGPEFVALGERLAEHGVLTPRVVGDASRTGRHDEQALKRVWHYLARFGYRA
ncbi:DUF3626 domain-containing protein [Intrasporangium sp.]|uniref:DUF3626 domain-containing protein n=1 Tax=Intrasporangium sp. TaxID=1925024 RepID=UPI002939DFDD|nr:DUF3626 domain-containing protein [Intrasporangium sp.]MDV3219834.1 DUF3626 domain-containing protein [Intrasporangium sp.]